MNVVFVEPWFPRYQREFARALAEAGATVIGIGEYSADGFDDQLMLDTVGRTLHVYAS
jgi:hypothetical protein